MSRGEVKSCATCGRRMHWRPSWDRNWPNRRYCSAACRKHRLNRTDRALEAIIMQLLHQRARGDTICPSEAARSLVGDDPLDWRPLLETARRAGRRLAAAGEIEFTQAGRVVDPSTARGPVRLRRAR